MDNFGKIKLIYNSLLAEGIVRGDKSKKLTFKKYVKTVKESEVLKTQFNIYYEIENRIEADRAKAMEYLNECLSLVDKFSKKEIKEANINLSKPILFEQVSLDGDKVALYENISTLILTKKTAKTLNQIFEAKDKVVDYILNNKKEEIVEGYGLPNSALAELAVDRFNDEYSELSESEFKAINIIIAGDNKEKEALYNTTIKECLELINNKLSESSGDVKEKLLATKENLLNRIYVEEGFVSDISKVLELKKYLTQD